MKFCEKCGNMLFAEKKGKNVVLTCRKCGKKYKAKGKDKKLSVDEKFVKHKKEIVVIDKKEVETELPVINVICPECSNKKAYWWTQETAGLTEESATPTIFYQCTKCKHKWRSYG
ncbi:MAG TPA: transcription factor S [archaeon]|nr:transcription factor S [archaeon]